MKTLLEKAKEMSGKGNSVTTNISQQDVDLAVSWAKGEIKKYQVAKVKGIRHDGSPVYVFLSNALREYVRSKNQ